MFFILRNTLFFSLLFISLFSWCPETLDLLETKKSNYDLYKSIHLLNTSISNLKIEKTERDFCFECDSLDLQQTDMAKSLLKIKMEKIEGDFCFECDSLNLKQTDMAKSLMELTDSLSSLTVKEIEGRMEISLFSEKGSCNGNPIPLFDRKNDLRGLLEDSRPLSYRGLLADEEEKNYKLFVNFCLQW